MGVSEGSKTSFREREEVGIMDSVRCWEGKEWVMYGVGRRGFSSGNSRDKGLEVEKRLVYWGDR